MVINRSFIKYTGFLGIFGLVACGPGDPAVYPEKRDITASVYASATVQPDSMYRVHAAVSGILEKNLVGEGDLVHPGTPLLQITDKTPRIQTENARIALELAQEKYLGESSPLNNLRAQIRTAELGFQDDSLNYERQKKLWSQQIGSRTQLENRLLAYERSRNNLLQLQTELERMRNELESARIQARNNYEASLVNEQEFTVRSTINATVYALYKEPGELVLPNEPLAMLGSPDIFIISMLVDEVDVVEIRAGQRVALTLDAFGEKVFEAVVSKIYPQKNERNQTFTVEARFLTAPATLYPGLSGEANIIVSERRQAMVIPKNYLMDGHSVRTEDGIKELELGIETLEWVEVLSGINMETALLKPEE